MKKCTKRLLIDLLWGIMLVFGHFWAIFRPQRPHGYPYFSVMALNLSQQLLRCKPVSENCSKTTFFHVISARIHILPFSLFLAFWGAFRGAGSLMGVTYRAAHGPELHRISPH